MMSESEMSGESLGALPPVCLKLWQHPKYTVKTEDDAVCVLHSNHMHDGDKQSK